jgi:hypothetical protein
MKKEEQPDSVSSFGKQGNYIRAPVFNAMNSAS